MVSNDHTDPAIHDAGSEVQTGPESLDFGFFKRIKLRLFGSIYVGERRERGWISTLPSYVFECKEHGLQFGYPTGYSKRLLCPECTH